MYSDQYYILMVFVFMFGAIIGSFVNVLIYRLPLGIEPVFIRSFCPKCKETIPFYRNIPILTFLFQRGKCANCQDPISWQYPIVEVLLALLSLLLFPKILGYAHIVKYLFLFSVLAAFVVHFIVDIRHQILPNVINIYLGLIFLLYGLIYYSWQYWLIGFSVGLFFPPDFRNLSCVIA